MPDEPPIPNPPHENQPHENQPHDSAEEDAAAPQTPPARELAPGMRLNALDQPEAEDPYEGAVPPGYDWPTHGGYLGCLVGVMAGALVSALLGANLLSVFWAAGKLSGPLFLLLAIAVFCVCVYLLGRLGYVLGKRFYRAYPQPLPSWGEDTTVIAAATPTTEVAHRGRLGAALGVVAGCLLGIYVMLKLFGVLGVGVDPVGSLNGLIALMSWVLFAALGFAVCIVGLRQVGWLVGKRFAREVPAPVDAWGEPLAAHNATADASAARPAVGSGALTVAEDASGPRSQSAGEE